MSSGWARSAWAEFIQRTTVLTPDPWLLNWEGSGRGKQQRFFRMRNCSRWAESGVVHWDTGLAISCLGVASNGSRSETSVLWQSWRWREWGDDQTERDIMESSETMVVMAVIGDIFDTHWGVRSLASLMWSCQIVRWQTHHDIMSSMLNVTGPRRRSGPDIYRDDRRLCQVILVTLHCSLRGLVWKYEHNQ